MEPQEPNPHNPSAAEEALRQLEERLSRASEAAERLIAEAAGSVRAAGAGASDQTAEAQTGAGEPPRNREPVGDGQPLGDGEAVGDAEAAPDEPAMPPPAGWQTPPREGDARGRGDLELLMQLIQSVREVIPPDLQRRLAEALRELLLAIRALIDWYLERSEQRRAGAGEVQDIPIL
jgi:hypothetical protein